MRSLMRKVQIQRKTKETEIKLKLNVDGSGKSKISTGIGILDHLLELFAFHGLFDLEISAKGDLKVGLHHTNEDIGIVLGQAFKKALADKKSIRRFGSASVPMEEVVATVTVDISGRDYCDFKVNSASIFVSHPAEEGYTLNDAKHFFESLAKQLGMNLNIKIEPANPDLHTTLEPAFKALGLALDQATQTDPRRKGVPSTKGVID